ncbi:MAG TPA: TetR/AcrR family transcriptional regulator [Streptosporangiaceae bacterium]
MPRSAGNLNAEVLSDEQVAGPLDEHRFNPAGAAGTDGGGENAHRPQAGPDHGPAAGGMGGSGRRPGRPRSERAEHAIIQATLELFAERGAEGVCVEEVAARAGVGKATVYRRWSGKEDLLLAALGSLKSPLPEPRGVSVRDDLVALLTVMCEDAADPAHVRQYGLLLGEGHKYPRLMARYGETVIEPRRDHIRSVLRQGISNGQLRPDTDVEIAMLTLTGAALARGKYESIPRNQEFAERIVDSMLLGLIPR